MRLLDFSFKLCLWFLLTADASLANIAIGVCIALLLPTFGKRLRRKSSKPVLKAWLKMMWQVLLAIPRAYIEAIEMMINPHTIEMITTDPSEPQQTRGLLFLDIFLITFTPKTIVVDYTESESGEGHYLVHSVHSVSQRSAK